MLVSRHNLRILYDAADQAFRQCGADSPLFQAYAYVWLVTLEGELTASACLLWNKHELGTYGAALSACLYG